MSNQENTLEVFKATAKASGWATTVNITGTEWTIQADETQEDGGTNTGPNPMQYFAASLASEEFGYSSSKVFKNLIASSLFPA